MCAFSVLCVRVKLLIFYKVEFVMNLYCTSGRSTHGHREAHTDPGHDRFRTNELRHGHGHTKTYVNTDPYYNIFTQNKEQKNIADFKLVQSN